MHTEAGGLSLIEYPGPRTGDGPETPAAHNVAIFFIFGNRYMAGHLPSGLWSGVALAG